MVSQGTNALLSKRREKTKSAETDDSIMPSPPSGLITWQWKPKSEKEIVLNLRNFFDFQQTGNYSIRAVCEVYSPITKMPAFMVSSDNTSFQIVKETEKNRP
jgi:hypothetical protein